MKPLAIALLTALSLSPRVSRGAVSCRSALEGWVTAQNLLKVPAAAAPTRTAFLMWLRSNQLRVHVTYKDQTGEYKLTGGLDLTSRKVPSTHSVTTMVQQTVTTVANGAPSTQVVNVPVTNTQTVNVNTEYVRVLQPNGITEIPLGDVLQLNISPGVKRLATTKLNAQKLLQDLLHPQGFQLNAPLAVPTTTDGESVFVAFDRGNYKFNLIYFTTKSKMGDPLARPVELLVFPTEVDRQGFEDYLGDRIYNQYFTPI